MLKLPHLLLFSLVTGSILMGCATQSISYPPNYRKNDTLPPLELPPTLSPTKAEEQLVIPQVASSKNTTESIPSSGDSKLLPTFKHVKIQQQANSRTLLITSPVEQLWPKIQEFWKTQGFTFSVIDAETGILETDWQENRPVIPEGGLRGLIGKVLNNAHSASTRDKFRTRLARGSQPDTTELYLTHKGMEEVSQHDSFVWQSRPTDPELEMEFLNRLMTFLGNTLSSLTPNSHLTN